MKTLTLPVENREVTGTGRCRSVRREGKVPAVIYGLGRDPALLSADAHAVERAIEAGVHVVELRRGDDRQVALVKDVQFDGLGQSILHVDFMRIDENVPVHVYVRIRYIGVAPSVSGSIVEKIREDVQLEVLPLQIPDEFVVNLSNLEVGEHITVGDLPIPEGCRLYDCQAEDIIVINHMMSHQQLAAQEAPEPTEGEESVEPEVAGEKKSEDGEE